jgi:GTP-binding protein
VAKLLYKSNKPVIVAVNKIDNIEHIGNLSDFYALGLGDPMPISGAHGIGIGDLLDKIITMLPEKDEPDYGNAVTFCLIGRPNVGKSSLTESYPRPRTGHRRCDPRHDPRLDRYSVYER